VHGREPFPARRVTAVVRLSRAVTGTLTRSASMIEAAQSDAMHTFTTPANAPLAWETPVLVELRVGMEVTSYESADIDTID